MHRDHIVGGRVHFGISLKESTFVHEMLLFYGSTTPLKDGTNPIFILRHSSDLEVRKTRECA